MSLEVITGPMFSGKSTELIRRLRREQIAHKVVLLARPAIDHTRLTHDGARFTPTITVNTVAGILAKSPNTYTSVIGIDECQFFTEYDLQDIKDLYQKYGKTVIVAGLDTTYRYEPFGIMPQLMALADRVDKFSAVCVVCGAEGTRTQRLVNGEPAKYDDPTVLVGEEDYYEARCATCWQLS